MYQFLLEVSLKILYRWYDVVFFFFSTDYGVTGEICKIIQLLLEDHKLNQLFLGQVPGF